MSDNSFDIAIIGGGLAGLSLAIQLQRVNHSVILFEKEQYPFHKVCGEYISMESWPFLEKLGVPLSSLQLPIINNFLLTSPDGKVLKAKLPLGGFGISRYKMDHLLFDLADKNGVKVFQGTKVEDVQFENDVFKIKVHSANNYQNTVMSKVCCGSFGKRSNIDIKWNRNFVLQERKKNKNYVGVKYHVKAQVSSNEIALHNFENGYCGISEIEGDKCCFCYLTTAQNLKKYKGSIREMEKHLLSRNPHLKKILGSIEVLEEFPITISQISFAKKEPVYEGVLLIGDAAGMITPLCGNGMSMALHSSKLAFNYVHQFLGGRIERVQMEKMYALEWNKLFANRLRMGRLLQAFFGKPFISNLFVSILKTFTLLVKPIIRQTHGKPF